MSEVFSHGRWITSPRFAKEEPLDIFQKGMKAKWVERPREMRYLHTLMKRDFVYTPDGKGVTLRITGDDYYKLYLNGVFVCQGPAVGYPFRYYWNEVELTPFLQEGENRILADVYYHGTVARSYSGGDRRMGLIAEAMQGEELLFATDESWLCTESKSYTFSHTLGYDTSVAENFDARVENRDFVPVCGKDWDHVFSPTPAKLLQHYEKEAVAAEEIPGGFFYDFGEEVTGTPYIRAYAPKGGEQVKILLGEETEDTPIRTRFDTRCNCRCEEIWTLKQGENVLDQYDYKAFRYMSLLPDAGVEVRQVHAKVRHYPFDDAFCRLETENETLQGIWRICKNGVKYGSQEVFTDCPMREKGQYAGDLTVTGGSHLILTGDLSLFEKAMEDQMASARLCPGLIAVTPGSHIQEIADYSLQFPILALRHYAYTGDRGMLSRSYEICKGIVAHFGQFAGEDGLLEAVTDKWNLVDWPQNLRDGYDFPLKEPMAPDSGAHNVLNAFYIGCVKQTEAMGALLGEEGKKESPALEEAFYRAFYRKDLGLFADSRVSEHCSLHSNVLPAYYGICRKEDEKAVGDFILERGLCCGVYMAYFLLKGLCRMERHQDALTLLLNESEHSWVNMLREGATCCMEAWGKEQKDNTSLCHPWASAPISVLAEDLLPRFPQLGLLKRSTPVPREIRGI